MDFLCHPNCVKKTLSHPSDTSRTNQVTKIDWQNPPIGKYSPELKFYALQQRRHRLRKLYFFQNTQRSEYFRHISWISNHVIIIIINILIHSSSLCVDGPSIEVAKLTSSLLNISAITVGEDMVSSFSFLLLRFVCKQLLPVISLNVSWNFLGLSKQSEKSI